MFEMKEIQKIRLWKFLKDREKHFWTENFDFEAKEFINDEDEILGNLPEESYN